MVRIVLRNGSLLVDSVDQTRSGARPLHLAKNAACLPKKIMSEGDLADHNGSLSRHCWYQFCHCCQAREANLGLSCTLRPNAMIAKQIRCAQILSSDCLRPAALLSSACFSSGDISGSRIRTTPP